MDVVTVALHRASNRISSGGQVRGDTKPHPSTVSSTVAHIARSSYEIDTQDIRRSSPTQVPAARRCCPQPHAPARARVLRLRSDAVPPSDAPWLRASSTTLCRRVPVSERDLACGCGIRRVGVGRDECQQRRTLQQPRPSRARDMTLDPTCTSPANSPTPFPHLHLQPRCDDRQAPRSRYLR